MSWYDEASETTERSAECMDAVSTPSVSSANDDADFSSQDRDCDKVSYESVWDRVSKVTC